MWDLFVKSNGEGSSTTHLHQNEAYAQELVTNYELTPTTRRRKRRNLRTTALDIVLSPDEEIQEPVIDLQSDSSETTPKTNDKQNGNF